MSTILHKFEWPTVIIAAFDSEILWVYIALLKDNIQIQLTWNPTKYQEDRDNKLVG